MIFPLFIATFLSIPIKAVEYELLVQQDSSHCYFRKTTIISNNGNQGTPTDYCYSNIGTIAAIKDEYRDENGKFGFRLTYEEQSGGTDAPVNVELVWTQSSWIQDSVLTDVDLSQIPPQAFNPSDKQYFHGLGLSVGSSQYSYLDGTPGDINTITWFNAVVTYSKWISGIPGFNGGCAIRNKLEILVPDPEGGCIFNAGYICEEIASVNDRVDMLQDYLHGTALTSAHSFGGDVIGDTKNSFAFSATEVVLFGLNMVTIVIGLFICWKGGLFSKHNGKYATIGVDYEPQDVDKAIIA